MSNTTSPTSYELAQTLKHALSNYSAQDITHLQAVVTPLASEVDFILIATGVSSQHVKSISQHVCTTLEGTNISFSIEGEDSAEWVIIDAGSIVVHIMQPATRDHYQLEKLWCPNQQSLAA